MMGLSTAKLIGGLVAILLVLGLVAERSRWMHRAHTAEAENATVCAAIRAAADNPKMDCKRAAQQVGLMGQSIANLKAGIAKQNAAVNALATESDRQKAEAANAVLSAATRARASQATSDRLAASSRSGEAQAKPCDASKALKGAWR
jgi:hypothetical protein